MIVSHCHISPLGFGNEPEVGTLSNLKSILNKVGADGAAIFAPLPFKKLGWSKEIEDHFGNPNNWLIHKLKRHPNLFGVASINPKEIDSSEQLKDAVKAGFVAVKIHPPVMKFIINDPKIGGFFETAEELGIPVHIHTGVHAPPFDAPLKTYMPILIDDVAQKHSELPIIIEHLGGYAFFEQTLGVLQNNKNCYAGLTACSGRIPKYYMPPNRVNILLKSLRRRRSDPEATDRIIYGLDYPWNMNNLDALKEDINWVESWNIAEEGKKSILGDNYIRLVKK